MYKYIECNHSDEQGQFKKFNHLDEVKDHIGENGADSINSNSSVYRIKDIYDAINTSVILDSKTKEDYSKMLTDEKSHFIAGSEFVQICNNVGTCDIF